jgi:hypothetical protein
VLSRRRPPNQKSVLSKINILDLPTETTATIFRYAHKPKDFHFLLPSGAGPLIPRAYNLPLTVSKEWYRRALPIYYETLRLTWLRIPEFVENVQRFEKFRRYINGIHVRIQGKAFYKVVKGEGRKGGEEAPKLSSAQLCLLIGQYIDTPLATFALCLDSLSCLKDLTIRFTDCKGSEVSLQSNATFYGGFVADGDSYCVYYCKFTPFGTEFIFGLCDGCETVCYKSIFNTSLSDPSKTFNKSKIYVSFMSISGTTLILVHRIISVSRFISP